MENKKIRLDYLDIVKAIAIILVVFGHNINPAEPVNYITKLIFSFHLPLFFMACGVTSHINGGFSVKNFIGYVKRNAFALILPYFIWGLIYLPFSLDTFGRLLYGSCEMFIGTTTAPAHLWFLPCFFLCRILTYFILYIEHKTPVSQRALVLTIIWVILLVIGFNLPRLENGYPWCLNVMFIGEVCIIGAHLFSEFINYLNKKSILVDMIMFVVFGIIAILGNLYGETNLEFMSMCLADYGDHFWFLINAMSGVISIRSLASAVSQIDLSSKLGWFKKGLVWLGQNTMGIYIVHMPLEYMFISTRIAEMLNASTNDLSIAIISTLIALPLSIIINILILKVVPELFGKHRQIK